MLLRLRTWHHLRTAAAVAVAVAMAVAVAVAEEVEVGRTLTCLTMIQMII
jgi:hypothetical protein